MTSPQPTGVIELFVLQASDYIEQIDGVLNSAGNSSADGEALARGARMLRGSATMTKLPGVAEVAAGIERVGRALVQAIDVVAASEECRCHMGRNEAACPRDEDAHSGVRRFRRLTHRCRSLLADSLHPQ